MSEKNRDNKNITVDENTADAASKKPADDTVQNDPVTSKAERKNDSTISGRARKVVKNNSEKIIPVLPLRDAVIYPHMVLPIFIGRLQSSRAIEISIKEDLPIALLTQKDTTIENPTANDLYDVGTIAHVLQALKLPDDNLKVLVESVNRIKIKKITEKDGVLFAEMEEFSDIQTTEDVSKLASYLVRRFAEYAKLQGKIPQEIINILEKMTDYGRLADTIVAHLPLKMADKQQALATQEVKRRVELTAELLEHEIDTIELEENLKNRIRSQVDKTQREFYLNEKLKAIQEELKSSNKQPQSDLDKLEKSLEEAGLSVEAKEKADAELAKLKMIPSMSPEATVGRNYLDWMVAVPWQKKTALNKDLAQAEQILERDHYGLEKVKERIIEYLAVQNRVEKIKGAILCLVGPPGVGKTSLGQSIAHATGREFIRVSLGGVRDEAEIRGHRRTYIGSMPGKVLQKMAKIKVRNPLFMLDEVDKMAMDFRGDPASALLEVLDPEQNHAFSDHYLEVDYDLSDVFFIATANSLDIPPALLDRMEVIRLAGYTEDEKLHIATRYLLPKQMKENGLKEDELSITNEALLTIIRYYTQEAGVRNLEREIAKICRKVVKNILSAEQEAQTSLTQTPESEPKLQDTAPIAIDKNQNTKSIVVAPESVEKYLGVRVYHFGLAEKAEQIGQVNGLAWTEVGGNLLTIEVAVIPGTGKTIYTGHLGEVMQESIQAALTVIRSRSAMLGIPQDKYEKIDIHVHVPEGATPKDGPSAGISMCTALASALTKIPVRAEVAMTGEITLRGEVLPIGGLKEKLLAALRGGIKTVIIPEDNAKDLKEIPENITQNLNIKPIKWIDQVLTLALKGSPKPIKEAIKAKIKHGKKNQGKTSAKKWRKDKIKNADEGKNKAKSTTGDKAKNKKKPKQKPSAKIRPKSDKKSDKKNLNNKKKSTGKKRTKNK